ncbi:MAG: hypothetical protein WCB79_09275 [Halobacteriota archaeon]
MHFNGTETASRAPYLARAEAFNGPELIIADVRELCSHVGVCLRAGGYSGLALRSNDPEAKRALEEAANCYSGLLVAFDKETRKPLDPELEPRLRWLRNHEEDIAAPSGCEETSLLKRRMGPHTKFAIVLRYSNVVSPQLSLFTREATG